MNWKTLSTKIVYRNPFLKIIEKIILRSDKTKGNYYILERPNFVVIIAQDKKNNFYLVSQFRVAIEKKAWEFSMGCIDQGEIPIQAAKRELKEETGLTAKKWKNLGQLDQAKGIMTSNFHIFLAKDLTLGKTNHEAGEIDMKVKKFTPEKLKQMILDGTLNCSITLSAYLKYILKI